MVLVSVVVIIRVVPWLKRSISTGVVLILIVRSEFFSGVNLGVDMIARLYETCLSRAIDRRG